LPCLLCAIYLRGMLYAGLKNILFHFDAEKVHHFTMNKLHGLANVPLFNKYLHHFFHTKIAISKKIVWHSL